MKVSVVIRTYNEARYLDELLLAVAAQSLGREQVEVVLVDSGSQDETLSIAKRYGCRIVHIDKAEFTFGRSLNMGCEAASGEYLAFISGHCVPAQPDWLEQLVAPLQEGVASYCYGRQVGRDTTKFSEGQVFRKYFPPKSRVPQEGFFCNNANAAITHDAWHATRFDEQLTGLEDLCLAKQLVAAGHKVAYVAEAGVYHIHDESWRQVRIRYEREALALREIMPEVHISFWDFLRYFVTGVLNDWRHALRERQFFVRCAEIVAFRLMQFWGTYQGNLEHRQISARRREEYFFPIESRRDASATKLSGPSAHESS